MVDVKKPYHWFSRSEQLELYRIGDPRAAAFEPTQRTITEAAVRCRLDLRGVLPTRPAGPYRRSGHGRPVCPARCCPRRRSARTPAQPSVASPERRSNIASVPAPCVGATLPIAAAAITAAPTQPSAASPGRRKRVPAAGVLAPSVPRCLAPLTHMPIT